MIWFEPFYPPPPAAHLTLTQKIVLKKKLKQVFLLLFQHLFVPLQPLNMYNQIKMLLKVSASDADLHLSRSLFEPLPTPKAVTLSFCLRHQLQLES